jgi:DNA-binding NtrC family response regulator
MATDEHSSRAVALIVDASAGESASAGEMLRALVEDLSFEAVVAATGAEALERFHHVRPAVILLDYDIPDIPGHRLLRHFREADPGTAVIVLATAPELAAAMEAMRSGARDFLGKSESATGLRRTLERVRDEVLAAAPAAEIREREPSPFFGLYRQIFRLSAKMRAVERLALQAAETDVPVLLRGEPGVGKELVAQAVHQLSPRGPKPWVKIRCGALPAGLLEAELVGKLEAARGGTLFLDEVGDLPLALQGRLVHVLETGKSSSSRGLEAADVNLRFIASTSRELSAMVSAGTFREDLYYQLDIVGILVPPLRERSEEIARLAQYFLEKYQRQFGRHAAPLSSTMLDLLVGYFWPGNIRELENVLKRYVVLGDETGLLEELRERSLVPARGLLAAPHSGGIPDLELGLRRIGRQAAAAAENTAVREALQRTQGNRAEAARLLKVSYKTLLNKLSPRGSREPGSNRGRF